MLNPKPKGYLLGAVAAASYGTNPLFALPLYGAGMNPDSVLLFRYLLALPILGLMLTLRGHSLRVRPRQAVALGGLGLLMAVSSLTLFLSYNYMAAGIASTLLFVYPILVAVLMALLFGERLSLRTLLCIAAAVGGIALLYKGEEGATLDTTGTLLVFASALSYAIYIVGVNRPGLQDVATLKVTFYVLMAGLLLFGGRLCGGAPLTLPSTWWEWGCCLALALFPTAISFLCTTAAIQYIGSTPTAILGALEPVTAVLLGMAFFGERLSLREFFGLVAIVTAVTFVVGSGVQNREHAAHPHTLPAYLMRLRKLFPRLRPRKRV